MQLSDQDVPTEIAAKLTEGERLMGSDSKYSTLTRKNYLDGLRKIMW